MNFSKLFPVLWAKLASNYFILFRWIFFHHLPIELRTRIRNNISWEMDEFPFYSIWVYPDQTDIELFSSKWKIILFSNVFPEGKKGIHVGPSWEMLHSSLRSSQPLYSFLFFVSKGVIEHISMRFSYLTKDSPCVLTNL